MCPDTQIGLLTIKLHIALQPYLSGQKLPETNSCHVDIDGLYRTTFYKIKLKLHQK